MKKIFFLSAILLLFSNSAFAQLYIGLDAIGSNASYKQTRNPNSDAASVVEKNNNNSDMSFGMGINIGYNIKIENFFIAPEISYEFLNNNSEVKFVDDDLEHHLQIQGRSMGKISFGYSLSKNFDIFASIGASQASLRLTDVGEKSDKLIHRYNQSPVFGGGVRINFNENWGMKIAYDYQKINVKSHSVNVNDSFLVVDFNDNVLDNISETTSYEIPKTEINLHTAKIGLFYSF